MPVPAGGGPDTGVVDWAPTLSQVASYVPHRTLVRADASTIEGEDTYRFTFDTTTIPNADQVTSLVADGCTWVSVRVSPLATAMEPLATTCAALYAAAMIERSWPNDDQSLQRANDLEKRLDVLMADLIAANNAVGGTGDFGLDIAPMPVWAFPVADCRWDSATYF